MKQITLQVLTLPSRANKVFPYHVRTTQIGVMEITDVTDADTTLSFRHHQYAPSAPPLPSRPNVHPLVGEWMADVPVELFTVSRSVALATEVSSLQIISLFYLRFCVCICLYMYVCIQPAREKERN